MLDIPCSDSVHIINKIIILKLFSKKVIYTHTHTHTHILKDYNMIITAVHLKKYILSEFE